MLNGDGHYAASPPCLRPPVPSASQRSRTGSSLLAAGPAGRPCWRAGRAAAGPSHLARLPSLPWAWVSAKWPWEGAVSHAVYLRAVFVWLSRVFACHEPTTSSEPSGERRSFCLGSGSRFSAPRLGAKPGRDFSRYATSQKAGQRRRSGQGWKRGRKRTKRPLRARAAWMGDEGTEAETGRTAGRSSRLGAPHPRLEQTRLRV